MRYLDTKRFIKYCEKNNINTDEQELEFYEREGYLLPVAREILPSEYIQLFNNLHYPAQPLSDDAKRAYLALFDEYPAVTRLEERLPFDGTYTDDQIIHIIDCELDHNPHLLRPTLESYVPWATYDISVMAHGHETKESVATTYSGSLPTCYGGTSRIGRGADHTVRMSCRPSGSRGALAATCAHTARRSRFNCRSLNGRSRTRTQPGSTTTWPAN